MAAVLASLLPWQGAGAQIEGSLFERLNLDRLRLTALGMSVGMVRPTQVRPTQFYAVHADYGEIVPHWRVVFTAAYWSSRFQDEQVRAFGDSLRRVIIDPSGDDTVRIGRVEVSDIALGAELRWWPGEPAHFLRPYVGAGVGAHVINTEGPAIDGTFVERALDYITAGFSGVAGLDVRILSHLSVGAQLRYDLLSGVRFGSAHMGASYRFESSRRPAP